MTFSPTLDALATLLTSTKLVVDDAGGGAITVSQLIALLEAEGIGGGGSPKVQPVVTAAGQLFPPAGGTYGSTSTSAAATDTADLCYAYLCPLGLVIDGIGTNLNTAVVGNAKMALYLADGEYDAGKGGLLPKTKIFGDDTGFSVNTTGVVFATMPGTDLRALDLPVWVMYKSDVGSIRRAGSGSAINAPFATGTAILNFSSNPVAYMTAPHTFATAWPADISGSTWTRVSTGSPALVGVRSA